MCPFFLADFLLLPQMCDSLMILQYYSSDTHISNNIDAFCLCPVYLKHWPYTFSAQWYPSKNQYPWSIEGNNILVNHD